MSIKCILTNEQAVWIVFAGVYDGKNNHVIKGRWFPLGTLRLVMTPSLFHLFHFIDEFAGVLKKEVRFLFCGDIQSHRKEQNANQEVVSEQGLQRATCCPAGQLKCSVSSAVEELVIGNDYRDRQESTEQ